MDKTFNKKVDALVQTLFDAGDMFEAKPVEVTKRLAYPPFPMVAELVYDAVYADNELMVIYLLWDGMSPIQISDNGDVFSYDIGLTQRSRRKGVEVVKKNGFQFDEETDSIVATADPKNFPKQIKKFLDTMIEIDQLDIREIR